MTVVAVFALSPLMMTWTLTGRPSAASAPNPPGTTSTARASSRSITRVMSEALNTSAERSK
jgi:hypothetical protein